MKPIVINKRSSDSQTVELLEKLLDEAKKGNLISLIFVDAYSDGKCGHGWTSPPNLKMLGELELVKLELALQTLSIE